MPKNWQQYNKLWVALGGAALQLVGLYFGVSSDYYVVLLSLLTALGVHQVTNAA